MFALVMLLSLWESHKGNEAPKSTETARVTQKKRKRKKEEKKRRGRETKRALLKTTDLRDFA